jgi:hypothetical protein
MKRLLIVILFFITNGCSSSLEKPNYSLLAEQVLNNTPEYTHFEPGTKFSWCLFEPPEKDNLPQLTKAVITNLSRKYKLYLSRTEIPNTSKILINGKLYGYKKGFWFWIHVEILSQQKIKIHYSDWVGDLASSRHFKVYKWNGKSWEIIEISGMTVSRLHNQSLQSDWLCQALI